jgi:hypothetical protein
VSCSYVLHIIIGIRPHRLSVFTLIPDTLPLLASPLDTPSNVSLMAHTPHSGLDPFSNTRFIWRYSLPVLDVGHWASHFIHTLVTQQFYHHHHSDPHYSPLSNINYWLWIVQVAISSIRLKSWLDIGSVFTPDMLTWFILESAVCYTAWKKNSSLASTLYPHKVMHQIDFFVTVAACSHKQVVLYKSSHTTK